MACWLSETACSVVDMASDMASWLSEISDAGGVVAVDAAFGAAEVDVEATGVMQLVQTVKMDVLRIVETVEVTC